MLPQRREHDFSNCKIVFRIKMKHILGPIQIHSEILHCFSLDQLEMQMLPIWNKCLLND